MLPPEPPFLSIDNLHLTFPNGNGGLEALGGVSLSLARQEFVSVLGPSGSGKTTLLRAIAGLLRPTRGSITFSSGGLPPCLGMVFQQANLMPWRTAIENITLPLELQGVPADQACARAEELIRLVGLEGFASSWPRHLSGGMAQRVALARALIQDPDLLLLDEPFGSLDALTRERMGAELLNLWQSRRTTVLMVTHSISEALLLSDRVLVFTPRPGQVFLDLPVTLPRPRTEEVRYTPEFGDLSRRLRAAIRE
jgi:NitT/TauT family transport system ATP-binding protein